MRRDAGFTLVELMVVLLVIGLTSGMVMLSLPGDDDAVTGDAESFAARLVTARDLAVVSGRDTAVRIDGGGYRFEERSLGGWRPAAARPLKPRRWTAGLAVRPEVEGGGAIRFDPTGGATAATVTISRGDASARVRIELGGGVRVDAG